MVFANERKESDKHPDFTGQGLVGGVDMWVSMWVKRSKKTGEEFFSISVRPKDEARREGAQRQEQARVQQTYAEEQYARPQRAAPPPQRQQAPSRFQPARQAPPVEDNEFPGDFESNWEREE